MRQSWPSISMPIIWSGLAPHVGGGSFLGEGAMWNFDLLSFLLGAALMLAWLILGVLVTSAIGWVNRGGGKFPPRT